MASRIEVTQMDEKSDPLEFDVTVSDAHGTTRHHVTMARSDCDRLSTDGVSPSALIRAAFRFLIDREPKEAILARFDVSVISRYFPEFEARLVDYLGGNAK